MRLQKGFHGAETEVRAAPGVRLVHVGHPPGQHIDAHAHDWASLTIFRCGSYTEQIARGEIVIEGPAVAFHPSGHHHSNRIGARGLETTSFLIDQHLLRDGLPARLLREGEIWRGGAVARSAHRLVHAALHPATDPSALVCRFLQSALAASPAVRSPSWLAAVHRAISAAPISTAHLAKQLRLHPAWLARAYLHATGESVQATIRRHKVEHAMVLIRTTNLSLAQIAAEIGFCDQSHMVRSFHAVVGRSPKMVRATSARSA